MSPNDADWPVGPAHRQAAEAPVFPDRGFSAFAARWSGARRRPVRKMTKSILCTRSPLMALDRDAERVLEMVRLSGRPPYETLSAPEARELFLAAREVLAPDPPPVAEIRELSASGPTGAAVPLRLYRGAETAPGDTFPPSSTSMGAAGSSAISTPMTASAAISPMRRGASSSRSITASLPSTSFRRRSRTALPRRHGSRRRPQPLGSTASAWPSAATAPAATSQRWSA